MAPMANRSVSSLLEAEARVRKPTDSYDTILWIVLLLALLTLCAFVFLFRAHQVEAAPGPGDRLTDVISGIAGWYGPGFAGKPMKNGEIFNPNALTFAMNGGYPDGQSYTITWYGLVRIPSGYRRVSSGGWACARWTDTGNFTSLYGRVADLSPATMGALAGKDGFWYGLVWVVVEKGCLQIDIDKEER